MKHPLDSPNPSFSTSWEESWFSSARLSEKTFDRKRFWLTVGVVAVVEALLFCLVFQWKYLFPSDEVSDIYTRYENVEGIETSFIKDYKVNDTVLVDVTLLEARSDSAWNVLLQDFNITPPPQEAIDCMGEIDFVVWAAPKKDYSMPMDSLPLNNDLISMSWSGHKISVFSIETEQQLHSLKHNQFKESIYRSQNSKNKQNEKNN
jgi:hypothetical protein